MKGPKAILIVFLVFAVVFSGAFLANKSTAFDRYTEANEDSIAISTWGSDPAKVSGVFDKYGLLMTIGISALSLIASFVLYGILNLMSKAGWTTTVALAIPYLWWAVFGVELAFFENRYTQWANGIIFYIGYPMMYAGITALIAIAILAFVGNEESKPAKKEAAK